MSKTNIYYCDHCQRYFPEEEIYYDRPDGGLVHQDCGRYDVEEVSEEEILEELNK